MVKARARAGQWRVCYNRSNSELNMVMTLTPLNGKLALVIEQELLDRLQIGANTPLDVRADAGRLIVEAQRGESDRQKFTRIAHDVMDRYQKTFEKLAE